MEKLFSSKEGVKFEEFNFSLNFIFDSKLNVEVLGNDLSLVNMNGQVEENLATRLILFASRWFDGNFLFKQVKKLQLVLIYLQVEQPAVHY